MITQDGPGRQFTKAALHDLVDRCARVVRAGTVVASSATDVRSSFDTWTDQQAEPIPGEAVRGWIDQRIQVIVSEPDPMGNPAVSPGLQILNDMGAALDK